MTTFKTPGVYVEEISTFPPSVAEVETAIPAFFGFTEKGDKNVPKRIVSLKEFEDSFGFAQAETSIDVTFVDNAVTDAVVNEGTKLKTVLYYAMQLYFANGGGPCYITSTGLFSEVGNSPRDKYKAALDEIAKVDEPTLLVFPDAPFIIPDTYYSVMNDAIAQCTKLGDRFAIVDVLQTSNNSVTDAKTFRDGMAGSENINLKYGASYYPYLNTNISYRIDDSSIALKAMENVTDINKNAGELNASKAKLDGLKAKLDAANADSKANPDDAQKKTVLTEAKKAFDDAQKEFNVDKEANDLVTKANKNNGVINNLIQNQIKQKLSHNGVVLTPCAAMAGVYASVDNARGVWKAPANVSLNYVKSTQVRITEDDQMDMNIDVIDGKSINAIRAFTGQGIKVWGARTLDGNDNEWKYINVRRFFNMVEESVKKSTNWAVFEANDSNTWVKVRAMIENYLFVKWRDGAMAGTKPSDAYFVRVGLGRTMTEQDILEGRMIIEIGMAVVRPAEFIILRFSHKLQVS
jgi:uncharacterized protein